MRKLFVGLALMVSLTGCGYGAEKASTDRATVTVTSDSSLDERFNKSWDTAGIIGNREEARQYAKAVCQQLRRGESIQDIFANLVDVTGSGRMAGAVLGGSAYVYCPEYQKIIANFMRE